jgi:hypothetical protein
MENNQTQYLLHVLSYYFFNNLQKVLLLRLGLFSIVYLIFSSKKFPILNVILFIYFRIRTCGVLLDSKK